MFFPSRAIGASQPKVIRPSRDLISSHPCRPHNGSLIRLYQVLKADLKCEVLVIGGGLTGALCAHHLAKAGMDVAVLDKRDLAGGCTSPSTAMLRYETDTPLTELIGRMGKRDAERPYQVCLESIGKSMLTNSRTASSSARRKWAPGFSTARRWGLMT